MRDGGFSPSSQEPALGLSVSHAHPQPHDLPHVHTHVRAHTQGLLPSLPALTPQGTGNTHLVAPLSATDTHAQALSVPHNHSDSPSTHPHNFIQSQCESPTSHSLSLTPSQSPVTHQIPHTTLQPSTTVQTPPHLTHTHTHTQAQLPSTGLSTTPQLSPQQERGNPRDQSPPSVTRSVWSQRLSAEKNM